MKQHIIRIKMLFAVLALVVMATAGTWSSNNFLYQPDLGARGSEEKKNFDAGLDLVDEHLGKYKTLGDPGYATLSEALTTIGTETVTLTIPAGTVPVVSNTSIPANVGLKIYKGAKFDLGAGAILTIGGNIEAGLYQIFSGPGGVVFANGVVPNVFPEWWGAAGDGATDDYTAVAAALTAAAGKAPVHISQGKTFSVGTRVELPSNTTLYGGGTLKAKNLNLGSVNGFLYGSGKINIRIEGITVDCNSSAQTQKNVVAIFLADSDNCKIRNNKIICDYGGIYYRESGSNLSTFGDISNNEIDNDNSTAYGNGICIFATDTVVANNTILMKDLTGVPSGYNAHTGIVCNGYNAGTPAIRVVITGNTVKYGYTGIAGTYARSCSVFGNTLTNQKTGSQSQGIYFTTGQALSVLGNVVRDCDGSAINFSGVSDSTISANTVYYSTDGVNTSQTYGIVLGILSHRNTVSGNNVYGVENPNASSTPAGIYLVSGDENIVVANKVQTGSGGSSRGIMVNGPKKCLIQGNMVNCQTYALYVIGLSTSNHFCDNLVNTAGSYAVYDNSNGTNCYSNNKLLNGGALYTNSHFVRNWNNTTEVVDKTTDYIILDSDCGKRFTNDNATGPVTLTLPSATPGKRFHFTRIAGQVLRIDPASSSDYIRGGGGGKYLSLDADGTSVTLECGDSHYWEIVSSTGTSSFE